jgi:hypothetical protein
VIWWIVERYKMKCEVKKGGQVERRNGKEVKARVFITERGR